MILHVDMDAFYAAIEERDRPELVGRPVIVGGEPSKRGVVSTANYVARQYGIHSAMPSVAAHRLCPHGVFLVPRIEYYAEISEQIRTIFEQYTPLVEPISLDEAFLDVRGSTALFGSPVEIGRTIKRRIREELRLVASVGVAPNKFLAKLAGDLEKPDGFVVVEPGRVQAFLDPLPVGRIWGVGKVGNRELEGLGIRTIAQLRRTPLATLRRRFGRCAETLLELTEGRDDREVVPEHQSKSISHETTFEVDLTNVEVLSARLLELTDQVARRMRRYGMRAWTVQLKIRSPDFRTITRRHTLREPTSHTDILWREASALFQTWLATERTPVRLLGMGVGGLDVSGQAQLTLFDREENERASRLDSVTDAIRDRFGDAAIGRAGTLPGEPRPPDRRPTR